MFAYKDDDDPLAVDGISLAMVLGMELGMSIERCRQLGFLSDLLTNVSYSGPASDKIRDEMARIEKKEADYHEKRKVG